MCFATAWANRWAEAEMLKRLGRVSTVLGRREQAERQLRSAELIFREQQDELGAAGAREYLALMLLDADRLAEASSMFEELLPKKPFSRMLPALGD